MNTMLVPLNSAKEFSIHHYRKADIQTYVKASNHTDGESKRQTLTHTH